MAEAEPLYQQALAIWEKTQGPEHLNVGNGLSNLAQLYMAQGRYPEVEPLLQRALSIQQKKVGTEHPDVAATLNPWPLFAKLRAVTGKPSPSFDGLLPLERRSQDQSTLRSLPHEQPGGHLPPAGPIARSRNLESAGRRHPGKDSGTRAP